MQITKNYFFISFILVVFVLIANCEKQDVDKNIVKEKKIKLKKPISQDDFLKIYEFIPLGSEYEQLNNIFPDLSDLNYRIREYVSDIKIELFDLETIVEFRFKDGKVLERITFDIRDTDFSTADSIYRFLQSYYNVLFGNFTEEVQEDPSEMGYPIFHGSRWDTSAVKIFVGLNEYADDCRLLWSFK